MPWPSPTELHQAHVQAQALAERLQLSFGRRPMRGLYGSFAGVGIGSSIDFQDHRPYTPGDDPRYLDWQAYARSGRYTMKVYREEVNPRVDLVLDVSSSMVLDQEKANRSAELFFFCLESALRCRASVRPYAATKEQVRPLSVDALVTTEPQLTQTKEERQSGGGPMLSRVPWRKRSLRILISDLLFADPPDRFILPLAGDQELATILAPYSENETALELGSFELTDIETGEKRSQRVDPSVLERYRSAYQRHFDLWRDECRRRSVTLARVDSTTHLVDALRLEAAKLGVVEVTH